MVLRVCGVFFWIRSWSISNGLTYWAFNLHEFQKLLARSHSVQASSLLFHRDSPSLSLLLTSSTDAIHQDQRSGVFDLGPQTDQ